MAKTAMTKREFFTAVCKIEGINSVLADYATEAIEKIDASNKKRAEMPKTETKAARENAPLKAAILDLMTANENVGYSAKAIATELSEMIPNVQKASALLRALSNEEKINKRLPTKKSAPIVYFVGNAPIEEAAVKVADDEEE